MTEPVKTDEVKTDEDSWNQVSKDRTSTPADDVIPTAESAADDPLAGLPEPTRKLIEGLNAKTAEQEKRLHDVGQKLATAHGTMGSMKQQLDESRNLLAKFAPIAQDVEAKKKTEAEQKAAEKTVKLKAAREKISEYTDITEYLDLVLPADVKPEDNAKPEVVKAEVKPDSIDPDERRVLILQRELSDEVPGWMKKRDSTEFQAWLPKQSQDVQAMAQSWEVGEAVKVFKLFDKHTSDAAKIAQVEKDRQERLRRGESVQGRGGSNGNVDTSPDALWNQVARDRARARSA
jgi:hypothetical protein